MRVSLENYLYDDLLTPEALSLESISEAQGTKQVFVLLTDTKTFFSSVAKTITGDPYNHVSLALDPDLNEIYSYNIKSQVSIKGGFTKETLGEYKNCRYSLYSLNVTDEVYEKIQRRVNDYFKNVDHTVYNHLGLVNAVLKKGIFKEEEGVAICSQFVASILKEVGVPLFRDRNLSTVRPYEFVKTKLLKFVRRGTFR